MDISPLYYSVYEIRNQIIQNRLNSKARDLEEKKELVVCYVGRGHNLIY